MSQNANQTNNIETTNVSDDMKNSDFDEKDFGQECSENRSINKSQVEAVHTRANNFEKVSGTTKIVSSAEKTPVLESTKTFPSPKSSTKLKTGESVTTVSTTVTATTVTVLTESNTKLKKTTCKGKSTISTSSPQSKLKKSTAIEKCAIPVSSDSHFKLVKTASKEEPVIPTTTESPSKLSNSYSNLSSHQFHNTQRNSPSQYGSQITYSKPNLQNMRPITIKREYRSTTHHSCEQTTKQSHMTHCESVLGQNERNVTDCKQNWQNTRSYNKREPRCVKTNSTLHSLDLSHNAPQAVFGRYNSNDIGRPQNRQNRRSKNSKLESRAATDSSVLQTSHRSHTDEQLASVRYKSRIFFRTPNRDYMRTEYNEWETRSVTNTTILQTTNNSHYTLQAPSDINENQDTTRNTITKNIPLKNIKWKPRSIADSSIQHMSHNSRTSQVALNTSTHSQNQNTTRKSNRQSIYFKHAAFEAGSVTDPPTLQTSHDSRNTSPDISAHYENQATTGESNCRNKRSKNMRWEPKTVGNPSTLHRFHNFSQAASAQYESKFSTEKPNKQISRSKTINWKPRSKAGPSILKASYQPRNTTQAASSQYTSKANADNSKNIEEQSEEVPEFTIENFPPIGAPISKTVYKRIVTVIKSQEVSSSNLEEDNFISGPSVIQNIHHSTKTVAVEVKDFETSQNIEHFSHISKSVSANEISQSSKAGKISSAENINLSESQDSREFPYIKEPVSKAVYIQSITLIEEKKIMAFNLEEQRLVTESTDRENNSYSSEVEKNLSSENYDLSTFEQQLPTAPNDYFNSTEANEAPRTNLEQHIPLPDLLANQNNYYLTNYKEKKSAANDVFTPFQNIANPVSASNEENEAGEAPQTNEKQQTLFPDLSTIQNNNNSTKSEKNKSAENDLMPFQKSEDLTSIAQPVTASDVGKAEIVSHSNLEQHILFPDLSTNYRKSESADPSALVSFQKYQDLSFMTHPASEWSLEENVMSKEENTMSESYIEGQTSNNSSSYDFSRAGEFGYPKLQNFSYDCNIGESLYSIQDVTSREAAIQSDSNLEQNRLVDSSSSIPGTQDTRTTERINNYDYLTPQEFQFYQSLSPSSLNYTNNVTLSVTNRLSDSLLEEHGLGIRQLDVQNTYYIPNIAEIESHCLHNIQYSPYISYFVPVQDHQNNITTIESNNVSDITLEDRLDPSFLSILDTNFSPNCGNIVPIENNGVSALQNFPCVLRPISGLNYAFNGNFSEPYRLLARNLDSSNARPFGYADNYSTILQNILYLPSIAQPLYLPYGNSATDIDNYSWHQLIAGTSNVQENILIHQNHQLQYIPAIAQPMAYGDSANDIDVFSQRLVVGYQDNSSNNQNYHPHLLSTTQPVIVPYGYSASSIEDCTQALVTGSSDVENNISIHQDDQQLLPIVAQPLYVPYVYSTSEIEDYIRRLLFGTPDIQQNIPTHQN